MLTGFESLLRNAMDNLNEKQRGTLELCLFEGTHCAKSASYIKIP